MVSYVWRQILMFQTYEDAISWIHSRLRLGIKPGLKRMEWMMEKLDHPERRLKSVHIGGTNGKGSTVAYLRSILVSAGFKTGTFTSPYFEQFNERISLNGQPVKDEEILRLVNDIYPLSEELEKTELGAPTEFEVITAMAFRYFADVNPVDIALFEVGLGGRFDSTNIVHPLLSIITSIGLDHTAILGDTYEQIAFEKAGIIKSGVPALTAVSQEGALSVIEKTAKEKNAKLYRLGSEIGISDHQSADRGERFTVSTIFREYKDLEISMLGSHQTKNAALAAAAAGILNQYYSFMIEEKDLRKGLSEAYWPGRLELLSDDPVVLMDGAHNEEGIMALAAELDKRYSGKKIAVVFAALSDKKLDKMIGILDEAADRITFTQFDFPRAADAEMLAGLSASRNKTSCASWEEAIRTELSNLQSADVLVITGSLYFLSAAKPFVNSLLG